MDILSFVPCDDIRQPNTIHASKEREGREDDRSNYKLPLIESIKKRLALSRKKHFCQSRCIWRLQISSPTLVTPLVSETEILGTFLSPFATSATFLRRISGCWSLPDAKVELEAIAGAASQREVKMQTDVDG